MISELEPGIHCAFGYTGHGVGPSHMLGRSLASLALERHDEASRLAFVNPPPHAACRRSRFASSAATVIRRAILRQEAALERAGARPGDPGGGRDPGAASGSTSGGRRSPGLASAPECGDDGTVLSARRLVPSVLLATIGMLLGAAAPAFADDPVLNAASYPDATTYDCHTDPIPIYPGRT